MTPFRSSALPRRDCTCAMGVSRWHLACASSSTFCWPPCACWCRLPPRPTRRSARQAVTPADHRQARPRAPGVDARPLTAPPPAGRGSNAQARGRQAGDLAWPRAENARAALPPIKRARRRQSARADARAAPPFPHAPHLPRIHILRPDQDRRWHVGGGSCQSPTGLRSRGIVLARLRRRAVVDPQSTGNRFSAPRLHGGKSAVRRA